MRILRRQVRQRQHYPHINGRETRAKSGTSFNDALTKPITNVGDEAYWGSNRFGGTPGVLKGDASSRSVSAEGMTKRRNSRSQKALAQKALQRP
jgi:hypothetical protein